MNGMTISKVFPDFPFAHRQPNHAGHCRLIHGHNWTFRFTFRCSRPDGNNFVVDFGDLKWLKTWLNNHFDHTTVLNEDDPQLPTFKALANDDLMDLITVPNCGAEGIATFLLIEVNRQIMARIDLADRGVVVTQVTVYEDSKNSATASLS